jgi:hypothetical protein
MHDRMEAFLDHPYKAGELWRGNSPVSLVTAGRHERGLHPARRVDKAQQERHSSNAARAGIGFRRFSTTLGRLFTVPVPE